MFRLTELKDALEKHINVELKNFAIDYSNFLMDNTSDNLSNNLKIDVNLSNLSSYNNGYGEFEYLISFNLNVYYDGFQKIYKEIFYNLLEECCAILQKFQPDVYWSSGACNIKFQEQENEKIEVSWQHKISLNDNCSFIKN